MIRTASPNPTWEPDSTSRRMRRRGRGEENGRGEEIGRGDEEGRGGHTNFWKACVRESMATLRRLRQVPRHLLVCEKSNFGDDKSRHRHLVETHYHNYRVSPAAWAREPGRLGRSRALVWWVRSRVALGSVVS